jgi:methyltransferase (TIGR00027 family)
VVAKIKQNEYSVLVVHNDRPSRTAEYMALFRAVETAQPLQRRLFEDQYAIPLLSGALKRLAQAAQLPFVGRMVPWFLDLGWPCSRSSGVVRTRWIDDLVREAIRRGARQLVLLGAGFDSRAYRLEEAKDIPVFEVDHLATQRAKRARLQTALGGVPRNIRFVEVDFEKDDLERQLAKSEFDRTAPAAIVWEGVVSYLTESAVSGNLCLLGRLLAANSHLILTYVHKGAVDGSIAFEGSRRWKSRVRRSGEPFIFGFEPAKLAEILIPYGFRLESDLSTAQAATHYHASIGRNERGSELYRVATAIRAGSDQCPRSR